MINGAKAPDLPNYPFNSQLKLTAINIPSFACQPLMRISKQKAEIPPSFHLLFYPLPGFWIHSQCRR